MIAALEELTGHEVSPADLLSMTELPSSEPQHDQMQDREIQEWQVAELLPPLPPYAWGQGGEPDGEAVRYVPGVGFVAGEA